MSNSKNKIKKNKKRNLRKIQATDLTNYNAIEHAFSGLMDFDEWHNSRLDEWIDRISLSEKLMSASPHFRSEVEQMFYLEITDVDWLIKRPWLLTKLIAKVEKINKRYVQKVGKPIIALQFVPAEDKVKTEDQTGLESVNGLNSDSLNRDSADASEHIFLPIVE